MAIDVTDPGAEGIIRLLTYAVGSADLDRLDVALLPYRNRIRGPRRRPIPAEADRCATRWQMLGSNHADSSPPTRVEDPGQGGDVERRQRGGGPGAAV